MDSAVAAKVAPIDSRHKTPEQLDKERRRDSLLLSRTRVLHDLQVACNARYRQQLEQALAHLDRQIADLA
jgi:hypothetical protein